MGLPIRGKHIQFLGVYRHSESLLGAEGKKLNAPNPYPLLPKMEDTCLLCSVVLTKKNDARWHGFTSADTGGEPVCETCMIEVEKQREEQDRQDRQKAKSPENPKNKDGK